MLLFFFDEFPIRVLTLQNLVSDDSIEGLHDFIHQENISFDDFADLSRCLICMSKHNSVTSIQLENAAHQHRSGLLCCCCARVVKNISDWGRCRARAGRRARDAALHTSAERCDSGSSSPAFLQN